jgi:S-formylglutathione hydrolase
MWYVNLVPVDSLAVLTFVQGTGDNFYKQGQLLPENFIAAAKEIGQEKGVNVRFQPDYDHSYYTMASFSDDHIDHAAKYLFA